MKSIDPHFKKDFERRLDAWISKQGIWFQFSHARSISEVVKTMFDLVARLVVVLIIVLVVGWFYLRMQVNTEEYQENLQTAVIEGLEASDGKVEGVSRNKVNFISANLGITDVKLNGSETSFFEAGTEEEPALTALGVEVLPLGALDGTYSGWGGRAMTIQTLDIKVKSGAESDEQAKACYQKLFKEYEHLDIRDIKINRANISWGYAEKTKGSISGSEASAQFGREG